jgi:hypothetical protein
MTGSARAAAGTNCTKDWLGRQPVGLLAGHQSGNVPKRADAPCFQGEEHKAPATSAQRGSGLIGSVPVRIGACRNDTCCSTVQCSAVLDLTAADLHI